MLASLLDEVDQNTSSPALITAIDIVGGGSDALTTGFERKDYELMEGNTEICLEDQTTPKTCYIVFSDGTSQ